MVSRGGAGNMNTREDRHKYFGGTKRANICGRYKGLNEILVLQYVGFTLSYATKALRESRGIALLYF